MAVVIHTCALKGCGKKYDVPLGQSNAGYKKYCSMKHSHMGRRKGKTKTQLKAEKAEYDHEYLNGPRRQEILANRKVYHKDHRDIVLAAMKAHREKNPELVAEQKRRCYMKPEYREKKKESDEIRRATLKVGPEFAEAYMICIKIEKITRGMYSTPYERRKARGYYERKNNGKDRLTRA